MRDARGLRRARKRFCVWGDPLFRAAGGDELESVCHQGLAGSQVLCPAMYTKTHWCLPYRR